MARGPRYGNGCLKYFMTYLQVVYVIFNEQIYCKRYKLYDKRSMKLAVCYCLLCLTFIYRESIHVYTVDKNQQILRAV
jgi:hypothetical protein